MSNQNLLALPLFIFMGLTLEKTKIAEELLESMNKLYRNTNGGLAISVVLVGVLMGASTGIVGASVVTLGLLSLPVMLKNNYSKSLSCGVICASGTLGQIIPPSLVLILLADVISSAYQQAQLNMGIFSPETVTISDLFAGALLPGLLLPMIYIFYIKSLKINSKTILHNKDTSISDVNIVRSLIAPIFLIIIFSLFQFIYTLGAPIQEYMGDFFSYLQINHLQDLSTNLPPLLKSFLFDGLYAGFTTVAAFVPIIIIFFFVMTIVEDSGYFSRAAFLMDKLMEKMGLDGRGFVMMLMGYGCNVPALMGTKIMRNQNLRFLTMLTIPFSLCSARLQVFLFLTLAFLSSFYGALTLFFLYLLSFFTIFLTAIVFKNKYKNREPLILELPPYRFPTISHIFKRGNHEVFNFLNRATKFIVLGVVAVWLLTYFPSEYPVASENTYAGRIGSFFEPIFSPIGIDQMLIVALMFGFIAKEILIGALAVIFGFEGLELGNHLKEIFTNGQAISFMIFTLIYTPCVSTIATIRNESKSWRLTLESVIWSLLLAWIASFIFYQSYEYFVK